MLKCDTHFERELREIIGDVELTKQGEMTYIIIAFIFIFFLTLIYLYKPILRLIAEKRAIPKIEKILFDNPEYTKTSVLETIHQVTSKRLSDDMVLDYFYKIKGLQVLNINKPINFWLKIYLTSPTKVKLNYFEQVKFYETFLNYPKISDDNKKYVYKDKEVRTFKFGKGKTQLSENLISQRLA